MMASSPTLGELCGGKFTFGSGRAPVGRSRGTLEAELARRALRLPIPRPAATAGSFALDVRFPLAGLVSSFPRNVGGGDLPDSVGLISNFPTLRQPVLLLNFSIIPITLLHNFCQSRNHSSAWLLTQRMETVMMATSHQHWHPSSPAFPKSRPK